MSAIAGRAMSALARAPDPPERGRAGQLRVVLADQLTHHAGATVAALRDLDRAHDVVLMMEVAEETDYVPHHPKKIAYLFSAMRHFAAELRAAGVRVRYVALDDPANTGSFTGEVVRAVQDLQPEGVLATAPGEWRVEQAMLAWSERLAVPVRVLEDDRFLCSRAAFADWARDRRGLRMEHFYRWMRQRSGLLMAEDGTPQGGRWNFDADNRKPLPVQGQLGRAVPPGPLRITPDAVTRDVLALVAARFGNRFGRLEPFWFPVTRDQALAALEHFVARQLPQFGDYQDAMAAGDPFLYHSLLSLHINAGLLAPMEVCKAAEAAWQAGAAPLNAVEGFIRQILGWREYMRGVYWLRMPGYRRLNHFAASGNLPWFYWDPEATDMACVADVVATTRDHAYAHHIQRLMVTGQLAMLMGVDPDQINLWYLAVYADAYEWVELPNVHGMAIFADGGVLSSKPYAASGKYIQRMSDYCGRCTYDVKKSSGEGACPFNHLYWSFLDRHRDTLSKNHRMALILKSLDRLDPQALAAMRQDAAAFIARHCR